MITRRRFVASAAALTAAEYVRAGQKPNERIRVAVMGGRIRGKFHLSAFPANPDVEVTHIIEPDANLLPEAQTILAKKQKSAAATTDELRKVLDDPTVTALVVAAPDHWHALATVWACQAGKHVYVEKPCSHNLVEGRRMMQAARKYDRVVQVGTQRRSATHVVAAREYVAAGKLGKVPFARAWIAGSRPSIGKPADAEAPAGVNYSQWLGPAADGPFNPNRFHYNWHWFWDLGTGEIGNNGIHALDLARNVLQLGGPTRVSSAGGKYFYDDAQQTPDTQTVTFEFPGCQVVWEHRIWAKTGLPGSKFGVALHGEKGILTFDDKGWSVADGNGDKFAATPGPETAHVRNFLDCVKSGKRPNADIEIGHQSTLLCHLGNISHRVGRAIAFDPATETIAHDNDATALLGREYRKGFELPTV